MADDTLFCGNIGNTTDELSCCYVVDQGSQTCLDFMNFVHANAFSGAWYTGDLLQDCTKPSNIYESSTQDDFGQGNGQGPIRRFQTCANVPNMAGYLSQGVVEQRIAEAIGGYVSRNASRGELRGVTAAVTECLTDTCTHSRNKRRCRDSCSPVNLLVNNTTPDVRALNECLNTLCTGGYDSLPYADADIVGVGVFASYVMQCVIVVILWFGLSAFQICKPQLQKKHTTQPEDKPPEDHAPQNNGHHTPSHQELLEKCIVAFQETQCYFSGTIQIACLAEGLFSTNLLITFMLTPLSTNGVLPVIFTYFLLYRLGAATLGLTLLTTTCWLLSSVVYWILYHTIIPINADITSEKSRYRAYQQFMYKLSSINACGGYSALAACPDGFEIGRADLFSASHRLRILTPIIWSFSTACLIVALAGKIARWRHEDPDRGEGEKGGHVQHGPPNEAGHFLFLGSRASVSAAYWVTTLCFLAGIGMQLSLLSIGTSLKMMNTRDWSFGQIVAVTIWAPPLLEYLFNTAKKVVKKKKKGGAE